MRKKTIFKVSLFFIFLSILFISYLYYNHYVISHSALVLVDWMQEFKDVEGYLSIDMEKIEPNIDSIHKFSEKNQLNIFYFVDTRKLENDDDYTKSILVEIKPDNLNNIYTKGDFDASSNDEFVDRLNKENIKYVYLIGMVSNVCILETAKGLKQKGFKVYIIKDGIASHSFDNVEEHFKSLSLYSKLISKRLFFIKFFTPGNYWSWEHG